MSLLDAMALLFQKRSMQKIILITLAFFALNWLFGMLQLLGLEASSSILAIIYYSLSLLYTVFMWGYGVFIIRHIWNYQDSLPDLDLFSNLLDIMRNGGKLILTILAYLVPLGFALVVMVWLALSDLVPDIEDLFNSMKYSLYLSQNELDLLNLLRFYGVLYSIIFVPLIFIGGYAALIGIIRYADEAKTRVLTDFGENIYMVLSNKKALFFLFIRQIIIFILYLAISYGLLWMRFYIVRFVGFNNIIYLNIIHASFIFIIFLLQTISFVIMFHLIARFGMDISMVDVTNSYLEANKT